MEEEKICEIVAKEDEQKLQSELIDNEDDDGQADALVSGNEEEQ